jgi:hypothetical protein
MVAATADKTRSQGGGTHGSAELPSVTITSYNLEIRDEDGFVGDKASRSAFVEHLDALRLHLRKNGEDPLKGETADISKKALDALLKDGDPHEAALVLSAIERFAQSLAFVIRRFVRLKSWAPVERIVVGGGFRESRVGIVELRRDKAADLSKARVSASELWRHADDEPSRDEAIKRLGKMLNAQIKQAQKAGLRVAPFIGVGCPGLIEPDGSIDRGAQNLPGNWESSRFNLVESIRALVPEIGEHETQVMMHNDAVIQGLSEMPAMQDVAHWAVLTIGTGLGNASYQNRAKPKAKD